MYNKSIEDYKVLSIDGKDIAYSDIGSGPVVLCFHGSFGGFDSGRLLLSSLADKGYRVVTFSRPGFLLTPLSQGKTIQEQANLAYSFCQHLSLDKVKVIAYSGGTPSALRFIYDYSEVVDSAVYLTPVILSEKFGFNRLINRLIYNDFVLWAAYLVSQFFPNIYLNYSAKMLAVNPEYLVTKPTLTNRFIYSVQAIVPTKYRYVGVKNDFKQFRKIDNSHLGKIQVRSLVVYSDTDPRVAVGHANFLIDSLPSCRIFKFQRGGHHPLLGSQSSEILESIDNFYRD